MPVPFFTDSTILYAEQLNQLAASIPTKLSDLINDTDFISVQESGNVTSVAGKSGDVILTYHDVAGLAPISHTGDYNDLGNKPFVPTDTNQLLNSAGFVTANSPVFTGTVVLAGAVVHGLRLVTTTGQVNCGETDRYVAIKKITPSPTVVVLPANPVVGRVITVKDVTGDAATNTITVVPTSGLIDAGSNWIINQPYLSKTFMFYGPNWGVA